MTPVSESGGEWIRNFLRHILITTKKYDKESNSDLELKLNLMGRLKKLDDKYKNFDDRKISNNLELLKIRSRIESLKSKLA